MQALTELPADVIIPPRIVVTRESGEKILSSIANPGEPTPAMRELMRSDDGD